MESSKVVTNASIVGELAAAAPDGSAAPMLGGAGGPATWALVVLTLISVCNWVDRTVISILLDPIKKEFGASDTMMGLLTGFSFTLFYAVAAIPIARIADRRSRRNLLAIMLVLWSGMTLLGGLVRSFGQLLAARAGVAVSESAGSPTSQSMIVDYFPLERRPMALSVYTSSVYVGTTLSAVTGGMLAHRFGWRMAMVSVSLPGFLLALLLFATVREPARAQHDAKADKRSFTLAEAVKLLLGNPTFALTIAAMAVASMISGSTLAWTPAFLGRVFRLDIRVVGLTLGLVKGLTGIAGVLIGGWIAGRLSKGGVSKQLLVCMVAVGCAIAPFAGFTLAPDLAVSLACAAVAQVLLTMPLGVSFVVVQALSPPQTRALAAAIASFGIALFGGAGPLYIGMLNDALAPSHGPQGIRYALLLLTPIMAIAAGLYGLGARAHARRLGGA